MKIFEEGYDKDYIYEKGRNIPILSLNEKNEKLEINLKLISSLDKISNHGGVRRIILLTMRGAIKFNMWKRTEGGKMIASALIERDDLMITEKKIGD